MIRRIVLTAMTLAALSGGAAAQGLAMDKPVLLDTGVTAVCTGIGEAKDDPRWKAYPVRIEFATETMHYLAGAHVTVKNSDGMTLADVDCSGAWLLLQLPQGEYEAGASLLYRKTAPQASARFSAPKPGDKQKRVVLVYKGVNPND